MSHPLGVRELKHLTRKSHTKRFQSHPLGVRELKLHLPCRARVHGHRSHPLGVRELKLSISLLSIAKPMSHPLGVRELKLVFKSNKPLLVGVAPFRGA